MKPPKLRKSPNSTLDQATLAKLADAIAAVTPPAALAARMRERVMAAATTETHAIRAAEGEWKNLLPGITIKTLHIDIEQGTQTSLWRLQAGARIPPHRHSKDEECLVLEGSIIHDGQAYTQGDFLFAKPGARHKDFIAHTDALLMIRGERIPNKLLLNLAMLLPH